LVNWLNANPDELVIVEFDDQVRDSQRSQAESFVFDAVIQSGLAPLIFNVSERGSGDWPSFNDIVTTLGKQVIIEDLYDYGTDWFFNRVRSTADMRYPSTQVNFFDYETCSSANLDAPVPLPAHDFLYFYEDRSKFQISVISLVNGEDEVGHIDYTISQQILSCGFAPKYDKIDYEKMTHYIWSWQYNEPSTDTSKSCILFDYTSARWRVEDCSVAAVSACQSDTDELDWVVSSSNAAWSASPSCPTGYSFSTPKSYRENDRLSVAAGSSNVWLSSTQIGTRCTAIPTTAPTVPPPPPPTAMPTTMPTAQLEVEEYDPNFIRNNFMWLVMLLSAIATLVVAGLCVLIRKPG